MSTKCGGYALGVDTHSLGHLSSSRMTVTFELLEIKSIVVQNVSRKLHVPNLATIGSIFFRLDALALSVIATATWLAGWLAGCHTPVLYQNG